MPLSPLDVESRRFRRRLFGYDRSEVEHFLTSAADSLSQAILEREEFSRRAQTLLREIDEFRQRERTLIEALAGAERLAEERKALAHREAEQIVADARRHAERIITSTRDEVSRVEQQILRLKSEREGFENRLASLINEHKRLIEHRRHEQEELAEPRGRSPMPPPHPLDPKP